MASNELERAVIEAARSFVQAAGYEGEAALVEAVQALDAAPVTQLRDRDGDAWFVHSDGKWYLGFYGCAPWTRERIERMFGPVTEVRDGGQ